MIIYHFNQDTGELIGQGEAEISPLDPENYLIPRGATSIKPPADVTGKVTLFQGGKWIQVNQPEPEPIPSPEETPDPALTYRELRAAAYPALGDQLDMIWHAIDQGTPLDTSSQFYQAISQVKETYPKE
jgi:hypothetical protein